MQGDKAGVYNCKTVLRTVHRSLEAASSFGSNIDRDTVTSLATADSDSVNSSHSHEPESYASYMSRVSKLLDDLDAQ
jgi:hypothetical protein